MKFKISSFRTLILLLSSLLIFGAFTKIKSDKKLVSGLMLKNMDTSVRPGDNFDAYVNGTWIKNTKIPADKPSYGFGLSYMKNHKKM